MISIKEFLEGAETPEGLTISQVHNMTAEEMEQNHCWIQWALATDKPSMFNSMVPTVNDFHELPSWAVEKALDRFTMFLVTTEHWRNEFDHNNLRITRAIRCAGLNGLDDQAYRIHTLAMKLGEPSDTTKEFWNNEIDEISCRREKIRNRQMSQG